MKAAQKNVPMSSKIWRLAALGALLACPFGVSWLEDEEPMTPNFQFAWEELQRLEGRGKPDLSEAWGIERRWHESNPIFGGKWPPTIEQAEEFYAVLWHRLRIEERFHAGLGEEFFLFAVNTGFGVPGDVASREGRPAVAQTASRALQCALNGAGHSGVVIDGVLGPATLRALRRSPHKDAIAAGFRSACVMYYRSLPGADANPGWITHRMVVDGRS